MAPSSPPRYVFHRNRNRNRDGSIDIRLEFQNSYRRAVNVDGQRETAVPTEMRSIVLFPVFPLQERSRAVAARSDSAATWQRGAIVDNRLNDSLNRILGQS